MKIEFTWDQAREAARTIPVNERISSVIFFIVFSLGLWYLIILRRQGSPFYTSKFSRMDAAVMVSFWLVWIITAGLEGVLGLRWWSRLFDSFGAILVAALAGLWLFIRFPFDFSYFPQLLPVNMHWLLAWITNGVARVIIMISFLFHLFAAVYSPFAYKLLSFKGG